VRDHFTKLGEPLCFGFRVFERERHRQHKRLLVLIVARVGERAAAAGGVGRVEAGGGRGGGGNVQRPGVDGDECSSESARRAVFIRVKEARSPPAVS
jgi:hypothetical protein